MEKYDLCVIGAGPAGYAAAMRAVDYDKKVLLIEKDRVGGAGVWNGALSSKTWWEISRQTHRARKYLQTHRMEQPNVNFRGTLNSVKNAEYERLNMLENQINELTSGLNPDQFKLMKGTAKIVGNNEVLIEQGESETTTIWTENIIIATGSRPRLLPNIPVDEKIILTSDGISQLTDFPKSMVIVGAGVIGCEYATIFSNFGQTKVHLIDKGERILPAEDGDIVEVIERNLEKNDVLIHRNSRLVRMEIIDGVVEYELNYKDGRVEIFSVEKALLSVGRVANYENLWTDNVKIEMGERGIKDDDTKTSVDNIYAVGDVTADMALVNIGELEGRHAVEKMYSSSQKKMSYENISTIMFLNPEIAGVGLNEQQARALKKPYKIVTLDYACILRAITKRNTTGFVKLMVTDDEEMKVLGLRVVGVGASSVIQATALLIELDKGVKELAELIHPHPSITEGIQECARILCGKSLLKPRFVKQYVKCYHWHPDTDVTQASYPVFAMKTS